MSRIYVFAPSQAEADPIFKLVRPNGRSAPFATHPLRIGPNELTVIIAGTGPQLARATAMSTLGQLIHRSSSESLSQNTPQAVFVVGLCGGLTESLSASRIVTYTKCLSTEPNSEPLNCSRSITGRLAQLLSSHGIQCECVEGITSARIAVRRADRLALAGRGASVVDMESYEIVAAAGRAGVPTAVLRVVADTVDSELPDLNRALNAWGSLDGRKALGVALASPLRTYRLLSANKRAMRHLAGALVVVLGADWSTA